MPSASSAGKANFGILTGLGAFFGFNYGLQIAGVQPVIAGVIGVIALLVCLFGSSWAIDYWVRGSNCISANCDSDYEHDHKWFFFMPGTTREIQTRSIKEHGVDMYCLDIPLQFEQTHKIYGKIGAIHLISIGKSFAYIFSAQFMVRSNVVIFGQEFDHGHVWVLSLEEIVIPETTGFKNEPTYLVTYDQSKSFALRKMATEGRLGVKQFVTQDFTPRIKEELR